MALPACRGSICKIPAAWVTEIERRMVELDSGSVQTIPWEQLRARLYGRLSGPGQR